MKRNWNRERFRYRQRIFLRVMKTLRVFPQNSRFIFPDLWLFSFRNSRFPFPEKKSFQEFLFPTFQWNCQTKILDSWKILSPYSWVLKPFRNHYFIPRIPDFPKSRLLNVKKHPWSSVITNQCNLIVRDVQTIWLSIMNTYLNRSNKYLNRIFKNDIWISVGLKCQCLSLFELWNRYLEIATFRL